MTDELPREAEEALKRFAGTEVTTPGLDREGVMGQVRRRRARRRAAGSAGVAMVGLGLFAWVNAGPLASGFVVKPSPIASVRSVQSEGGTPSRLRPGQRIGAKELVLAEGERVEIDLAAGQIGIEGPAEFALSEGRVSVQTGSGRVTGTTELGGCGCEASLEGEATFVAGIETLQIVVVAGSVHVEPQNIHCQVVDLDVPAEIESATDEEADELPVDPAGDAVRGPRRPRTNRLIAGREASCDLGAQAEAYREAMRMRGQDDAGLVTSLRQIRRDYRGCPLSHEVDVALIETLLRSGRTSEASREARAFVRRYPRSARREDMQRIVSLR